MKKNKLIGLLLVAVSINTYVSSSNNNLDVGIIKKENKLQNVLSNEENGWNITNVLYKELSFDAKKSDGTKVGYYDGQLSAHFYKSKAATDKEPCLLVVELRSFFVPGILAKQLGHDDYDSGQHNSKINIRIGAKKNGISKTEVICKDVSPINEPFITKQITSSFGYNITYGTKTSNGISLNNVDFKSETSISSGINIGYSTTYTITEPKMNVAPEPNDLNTYNWNFQFNNSDTPKDSSFNFTTTEIYEVKPTSSGIKSIFLNVNINYTTHGFWTWDEVNSTMSKGYEITQY